MDDDYYDDNDPTDSPRSSWFQLLAWVAIVALGYLAIHTASRRGADWSVIAIGVLLACVLVPAIRRGAVDISAYGGGKTRGTGVYRRSADPVGFWTLIALGGIAAGVIVFGSLGDLLGLWQF